ncbi:hypothetical protein KKF84_09620 [Myxococcota bacterium]|nr:hypothetical protein [Myxococcota bacterium]MBU1535569.1 hypothetical protein [Myxococcota bacterium]
MSATIDELTVNYEEEGVLVRKEITKEVLSKGAWSTIMFKYQDFDQKIEDYGEAKAMVVRFRKIKGEYRKQSSFNISSPKQALAMAKILNEWFEV